MLALEVEYLLKRVLASTRENRRAVEWPPHPSRLFSALVAAYEECGLGDDARAALEWLEALPDPSISAKPPQHRDAVREVHEVFVPVNDAGEIPELRSRQVRWFPAFTPQDPCVWFIWNDAQGAEQHAQALQRIAENVTYLGHSMSPVRVCVSDSAPEPTLVPDHRGTIMLRITGKGRLRHLEETYDLRKANATIQPRLGLVARYRIARKSEGRCPASLFGHVFVFQRVDGPKIPLEGAAKLTAIVRKAVMDLYPDPVPEVISGHIPDGRPSGKPHLAVTPLPDVGHQYADGHVMGFALWLPVDVSSEIYDALEEALGNFKSLTLGKYGEWRIEPLAAEAEAKSAAGLRQSIYVRPHDTWATVTPVVFGKFPKRNQVGLGKDGGKVFADLCEMIGLPKPVEARVGPVSAFFAVPKASEFPSPDKLRDRYKAHVWVRFAQPVQGPVLLGAGRYAGFGLCRPWYERG